MKPEEKVEETPSTNESVKEEPKQPVKEDIVPETNNITPEPIWTMPTEEIEPVKEPKEENPVWTIPVVEQAKEEPIKDEEINKINLEKFLLLIGIFMLGKSFVSNFESDTGIQNILFVFSKLILSNLVSSITANPFCMLFIFTICFVPVIYLHPKIASVIWITRLFSLTSWTRTKEHPFITPITLVAKVPSTR